MTAPTQPNFSILSLEGVDLTATYTLSTSTPELPGLPFQVGTHCIGSNGSEYMFVTASTALAAYQCVSIDKTEALAVPHTFALNNAGTEIGWPQVAIAAGSSGWVALRGQNIGVLAKKGSIPGGAAFTAVALSNKLYISSTSPGTLTNTSIRTSALVQGVVLTTSCTSAMLNPVVAVSAPVVATATWPRGII